MVGDFSFSDSGAQLALANAVYGGRIFGGLSPVSIRIFGHAFYLALFFPLPRNFRRLQSWARIF